jgi:Kef-type K+ transport system membrane component KefB
LDAEKSVIEGMVMRRVQRATRLKVKVMVAQARRSEETRRIVHAAALPVATLIVVVWAHVTSLSREGNLSLETLAPVVWGGLAFTGVVTAFIYWYGRQG